MRLSIGPKYVSGVANPVIVLTRQDGKSVVSPVAMFRGCSVADNGDGTSTLTLSND